MAYLLLKMATMLLVGNCMSRDEVAYAKLPASAEQMAAIGAPQKIIESCADKTAAETAKAILSDHSEGDVRALKRLREFLQMHTPHGIAVCGDQVFGVYGGPTKNRRTWWRVLAPIGKDTSGDAFDVFTNHEAKAMIRGLAGFRDTFCTGDDIEVAGDFLTSPELAQDYPGFENSRDSWKNMYVIFHANNGDLLLCSPDGQLGWLVLELNEYRPIGGISDLAPFFVAAIQSEGHLSYWSLKDVAPSHCDE